MADPPPRRPATLPRYVLTSPRLYGEAISLFEPIYTFLEEALDRNAEHPVLGELHGFLAQMARSDGFKVNSILTGIFVLVGLALQHHVALCCPLILCIRCAW